MDIEQNFAPSLSQQFWQPLDDALAKCDLQRPCHSLSDAHWLRIGTMRALQNHSSGRAFLQVLAAQYPEMAPERQHFFETLKSTRRLALCTQANQQFVALEAWRGVDALAVFSELKDFDIYAGDGHFHSAAAHDPVHPKKGEGKYPIGHLFCLNLRNHALTHLCVADAVVRKREHDMRMLKRQSALQLRQGAPKGRKVLYVWDRAGIDFRQWYNWKHSAGIYFLSREKDNMVLAVQASLPFDSSDARNAGVRSDELVGSKSGVLMRRIVYYDVVGGREYRFLTNLVEVPPGVLAHLYKMRWDIEKVFDELKNKLGEAQSWASSLTAKSMQAQFLCLAHNLLVLYERQLEDDHGITNLAEIQRRSQRLEFLQATLAKRSEVLPATVLMVQRITQRSVKFIRWIRCHLFAPTSYYEALDQLRQSYAVL